MTDAPDLAARRALLKKGAADLGVEGLAALQEAVTGASEEERAALARTLPPSRLLRGEGYTPRAMLVMTALATPKALAEALAPWDLRQLPAARLAALAPGMAAAAADRDAGWGARFVEHAADEWGVAGVTVPMVRAVMARHGLAPESPRYLEWWLHACVPNAPEAPAYLRARPEEFAHEFWALFRVEGAGGNWRLVEEPHAAPWRAAVADLAADPAVRARLLDESLGALLRDFAAKAVTWYHRTHRELEPTPAETLARWDTHVAVLATTPSVAVGLSQDMLRAALAGGAVPSLDQARALVDAPVLGRTEKKLLNGQVALLAALADVVPQVGPAVGEALAWALPGLPADVARRAAKLVPADDVPRAEEEEDGPAVVVPGPRTADLPPLEFAEPELAEEDLHGAIAAFLEGAGDGALLPPMTAALVGTAPARVRDSAAWVALGERALEVIEGTYDDGVSAPRRHLGVRLRAWLGMSVPFVDFRGFRRHVHLRDGDVVPVGTEVQEYTAETWSGGQVVESHTFRSGYRIIPTHGPIALLVETLKPGVLEPDSLHPLPPVTIPWAREVRRTGEGSFSSREHDLVRTFDVPVGEQPRGTFAERALDASRVADEYGFRVQAAREQDGHAQIAQWAGRLYADNPDVFAAQFAPMLFAAVEFVNVRGVPEFFAALGPSRRVVGAPTATALALGLSAKEAPHRAAAAEALAALAEANLLDPGVLADAVAGQLGAKTIQAGRVAAALTDAAGIGALAGYRVLQTLVALLPATDGVTGAGKLYEAGAALAEAYGTPVPTPEVLARRAKGSSATALALRAMAGVRPRGTESARAAAKAAG